MAKSVDARDLKSRGLILRAGSSPASGTIENAIPDENQGFFLCKKASVKDIPFELLFELVLRFIGYIFSKVKENPSLHYSVFLASAVLNPSGIFYYLTHWKLQFESKKRG